MTRRKSVSSCGLAIAFAVAAGLALAGCATMKEASIRTDPPGANIYVNGEFIGKSPCSYTFVDDPRPGLTESYTVTARLGGHEAVSQTFTRRFNKDWMPAEVAFRLTPDQK